MIADSSPIGVIHIGPLPGTTWNLREQLISTVGQTIAKRGLPAERSSAEVPLPDTIQSLVGVLKALIGVIQIGALPGTSSNPRESWSASRAQPGQGRHPRRPESNA